MRMDDLEDLRVWAECALDPETASHLVSAMLQPGHPPFGDDWSEILYDNSRWMLAHATWRLAERGKKLDVAIHGRGIRVQDGKDLDVFVADFYEFDRVLKEWEEKK